MNRIIILALFGLLLTLGCVGEGSSSAVSTSTSDPNSVVIPASQITSTVKHYTYDSDGVSVRYFAVKGSDGVVRTAFDACEVCYGSKKGYTQVGNDVKCNNCGLMFKIDGLGTKNKGKGCWPAYLPHEVKGNDIVIKRADLDAGAYMFR